MYRNNVAAFFIKEVVLDVATVVDNGFHFQYLLDGEPIRTTVSYNSLDFEKLASDIGSDRLRIFAANLGAVKFFRFAAVLPVRFELGEYSSLVSPAMIEYLETVFPHWSEHRFQAGRMDFRGTEIVRSEKYDTELVTDPLLKRPLGRGNGVLVASGSGKDSLLCAKILEEADVEYDIVTYVHNLYGGTDEQNKLFNRLSQHLDFRKHHIILIKDDYFPWLDRRMIQYGVTKYFSEQVVSKPFRREAGEVMASPLLFAPIQWAYNLELAVVGHEKSADAVNLVDFLSGENVYHQWEKSIHAENAVDKLLKSLFENVGCVSITKPIYDVTIFKRLFQITGELPYLTNSCNIKKPWCCECEKCAYVFAGFSAFGDHSKTVACFGENLFAKESLLPIWRELLGLEGYIPWECVGLADEAQLYFYKAYCSGVCGTAIDMFCKEVLSPLGENGESHFNNIEHTFSEVDCVNHHIPQWLWQKVMPVLHEKRNTNG
ncbi:hypothetical protein VU04_04340 [Desulfobulbus sp. TB]|nr:hypothetical protein [Desulfobulbus sp. TB]